MLVKEIGTNKKAKLRQKIKKDKEKRIMKHFIKMYLFQMNQFHKTDFIMMSMVDVFLQN